MMYVRSIAIEISVEDDILLRNACLEPVKEDVVKAEAAATKPVNRKERVFMV